MAKHQDDFVDISSSADVNKVYGNRKPAGKRNKRSLIGRIGVLALSIVFLIAGSGLVYYYHMLDNLNYKSLDDTDPNGDTSETTVAVAPGGTSLLSSDDVLNILLFGQDAKGSGDNHGRSDTTILLSIDNVNRKLKLTSFQRDTYVTIPGYGDNKINAAFTYGGEKLSINTLEANFGIKVDKYATVDFSSFRQVIDALGGVDMELNLEEIEYINAQIDVNHQLGKTSFLEYDTSKELQTIHLDGYQALWYARDRGYENLGGNRNYSFSGDDWDRTQRQRKLIETIVTRLRKDSSLTDLVNLVNKVGPLVTTNLKKGDITFLVSNILTYISYDIDEISLPSQDTWRYGHTDDGQSVIVINDWNKVRSDLANFIYGTGAAATEAADTAEE